MTDPTLALALAAAAAAAACRASIGVHDAIGPGDGVGAGRDGPGGVRTITETSLTVCGPGFDFVRRHGITHGFVSTHPLRERTADGENRPHHGAGAGGLRFHLGHAVCEAPVPRSADHA